MNRASPFTGGWRHVARRGAAGGTLLGAGPHSASLARPSRPRRSLAQAIKRVAGRQDGSGIRHKRSGNQHQRPHYPCPLRYCPGTPEQRFSNNFLKAAGSPRRGRSLPAARGPRSSTSLPGRARDISLGASSQRGGAIEVRQQPRGTRLHHPAVAASAHSYSCPGTVPTGGSEGSDSTRSGLSAASRMRPSGARRITSPCQARNG